MAGGLCDRSWIDLALMGRLKLSTSADRKCRKPMQKEFGLQEKNPNKSDFFYFYNFSNLISLSIFGFKVMSAALSP
jgi:hypothetical protein